MLSVPCAVPQYLGHSHRVHLGANMLNACNACAGSWHLQAAAVRCNVAVQSRLTGQLLAVSNALRSYSSSTCWQLQCITLDVCWADLGCLSAGCKPSAGRAAASGGVPHMQQACSVSTAWTLSQTTSLCHISLLAWPGSLRTGD